LEIETEIKKAVTELNEFKVPVPTRNKYRYEEKQNFQMICKEYFIGNGTGK